MRIFFAKKSDSIYNSKIVANDMEKNSAKNFSTVEIDPATSEYYATIPEWMINDLEWYEGTEIEWIIDGDQLVLKEV